MGLRVNVYGNVCNNAYVIAKFLREADVDAHLFVERNFRWMPEHEDPELRGSYPAWIHVTGDLRWRRYGWFDGEFVKRLGDCDLIHTFYYGPIWARKTGRPFVFQTYGGDLNVLPFMTDSVHHRYLAWAQRRGIHAADMVFMANPKSEVRREAVSRLGLARTALVPLPIDTTVFCDDDGGAGKARRARYRSEWVFFHPARHVWTTTSSAWERKGNDLVFRAFGRFLQETGRTATLVSIAHGPDLAESRRLVAELGIGHAVDWIEPVQRRELVPLYGMADIVLDQFVLGGYGGCTLEALACARAVFANVDGGADSPPVVNVSTEDQIYGALLEHTKNAGALRAIGQASRRWMLANHDARTVMRRYIALYDTVLAARAS
jgi:glycosyltransferase involved in cell wall biosynthesis